MSVVRTIFRTLFLEFRSIWGLSLKTYNNIGAAKSIHTTLRFNIKRSYFFWSIMLDIQVKHLASLWRGTYPLALLILTHPGLATNHRSHGRALLGALMTFRKTKTTDLDQKIVMSISTPTPPMSSTIQNTMVFILLYFLVDPLDGQHTTQAVELSKLIARLEKLFFFLNCYGISAINSTEIAWKIRIPPNNIGEWFLSLETSPIWWYKDMLFFWFSFKTLNDLWIFTYFWYGTVDLFEKSGAMLRKRIEM